MMAQGTMPLLTGIHHLTAVSADAPGNHRFYTQALGMRLVKRTVNQDDTSAYHLFYADGLASPGTDLTFSTGRQAASAGATTASPAPACACSAPRASHGGPSAFAAWASRTAPFRSGTGGRRSTSRIRKASASASSTTAGPGRRRTPMSAARCRPSTRSEASGRSR